ncbi:unnamed protein product [Ambrosiozyma monospora]|uniref:Unnamed protein product n=1 Tax=Ambrosiozyma monospora TaxID=43982 RepID=A0ACB5T3H7_AMBMO|nr:unnamed protein product [Ambrosiozyma monospora]
MLDGNKIWYGGSETVVFNRLEQIAEQEHPLTPVLGAGITSALQRKNLKSNTFLPSRINWAIQSSGVDYLHLLLVSMEYLTKLYNVDARMCISIHDEIRYMVKEEDRYKCGMLLQIANLWTRAMFCHQLGIDEVPHSCAFFSAVDFDHILRKEVDLDCITPSNPNPIPHGESLDVYQILAKPEVQQMLNSTELNNIDLSDIKYKKTKRPTELLDSELDPATMVLWIRLQICQKPKEFKTYKAKFLDNLKLKQDSEYVKTLGHDNLTEEVVCEGTMGDIAPDDLRDAIAKAGMIIEEKPEKKKTTRKSKSAVSSTKKKTSNFTKTKSAASVTVASEKATRKSTPKKASTSTSITKTHSKSSDPKPNLKHATPKQFNPQEFYPSDPVIGARPLTVDQDIDLSILNAFDAYCVSPPDPAYDALIRAPKYSHGRY